MTKSFLNTKSFFNTDTATKTKSTSDTMFASTSASASKIKPERNHTQKSNPQASTKASPKPIATKADREQLLKRNQRTRHYLALVQPIAQFYASCSPEPLDDLVQVGLLGLLRAAELFKPEHQTPFEVFAKPHIRGSILHYLRDLAQPIRLPRRLLELKDRLNRLGLDQLTSLGLSQGDQRRLQEIQAWSRPLSLDSAQEDGISIEPTHHGDDSPGADAQQALVLLSHLEPQLQIVIRQVVLFGWSYRRTADQLNVSPMTVQRRLKRGLGLLKQALDQPQCTGDPFSPRPCGHPVAFAVPGC